MLGIWIPTVSKFRNKEEIKSDFSDWNSNTKEHHLMDMQKVVRKMLQLSSGTLFFDQFFITQSKMQILIELSTNSFFLFICPPPESLPVLGKIERWCLRTNDPRLRSGLINIWIQIRLSLARTYLKTKTW